MKTKLTILFLLIAAFASAQMGVTDINKAEGDTVSATSVFKLKTQIFKTTTQVDSDDTTLVTKDYLTAAAAVQQIINETPGGSINGVNNTYTTAYAFVSNSTRVYVNGVRQILGVHYTETGGNVVFQASYLPQSGDLIRMDYRSTTEEPLKSGIVPTYTPDYYVSATGDDDAAGTSEATAWATIDKVNATTFSPGDIIAFHCGDSFEGTITAGQSGTSDNPVTYGAYGTGERPKIYGSEVITGWSVYSGYIYEATFSTAINQLFANGVKMTATREPDTGYFTVTSAPAVNQITCSALNGALDYTGVQCFIHSSSYGAPTIAVASSSSTTLTLSSTPFGNVDAGEQFMLVGKLEFLDEAGEWFYDTATSTVYFWTPDSVTPDNYEVRGSTTDYGVVATSKNYLVIKDLDILHQKVRGISLSGCDYITIDNNTINYPDAKGIYAVSGSDYLTISGNIITGANHIALETFTTNSTISENEVYETALPENLGLSGTGSWYMGSGIYVEGADNLIDANRVDEVGSSGIHFYNRNTVTHNHITNFCRLKNDGGGIYTSSPVQYGTEPSIGSIVRLNSVRYGWGFGASPYAEGIYIDESAGGVTVENNNVAEISGRGIFLHDGNHHTVDSNTLFDCENGLYISKDGRYDTIQNNIVYGLLNQELTHINVITGTPVCNNNTYINHYTSSPFQIDWGTHYSLAGWQTATGFDSASTCDTSTLTSGYTERFIVNTGSTARTYTVPGATVAYNIDGEAVTGTFELAAYASIILTGTGLNDIE